jgi:hypothetical protein
LPPCHRGGRRVGGRPLRSCGRTQARDDAHPGFSAVSPTCGTWGTARRWPTLLPDRSIPVRSTGIWCPRPVAVPPRAGTSTSSGRAGATAGDTGLGHPGVLSTIAPSRSRGRRLASLVWPKARSSTPSETSPSTSTSLSWPRLYVSVRPARLGPAPLNDQQRVLVTVQSVIRSSFSPATGRGHRVPPFSRTDDFGHSGCAARPTPLRSGG